MKINDIWFVLGFWFLAVVACASFTWDYLLSHHDKVRNLSLVAAALIGAPVVLWRTTIAHNESQIRDQEAKTREADAQTRQQDANTNSANSIATAYTQAIQQLGADKQNGIPALEIRVGGIYALHKIALNNESYELPILLSFISYVRQQTRCLRETPFYDSLHDKRIIDNPTYEYIKLNPVFPREDIQLIFDLLPTFSANSLKNSPKSNPVLDFRFYHLAGVTITSRNQMRYLFDFSHLNGAVFRGKQVTPYTSFGRTSLIGATFDNLELRQCNWLGAMFSKTFVGDSMTFSATFKGSDIRGAEGLTDNQVEGLDLSTTKRDRDLAPDQLFPNGNDEDFERRPPPYDYVKAST